MKLTLILASLITSSLAFAGGDGPYAPTPTPTPKAEVICPEGCIPKPKTKPKPKPKPKPTPKPAPAPAPAPVPEAKKDCKPIERVVEKKIYVDREVQLPASKNSVYFLLGRGPGGLLTDHYDTKDRKGEFALRSGSAGLVISAYYSRNISESWSLIGGASSTLPATFSGGFGYHW